MTDSQNEADAHGHMSGFYKSEVQACNTFKDIQDIDIPKHFACVAVPTSQETQLSYTTKGFAWLTLLHTPRERAGNSSVKTRSGFQYLHWTRNTESICSNEKLYRTREHGKRIQTCNDRFCIVQISRGIRR
ncbi:hypothetical protein N7460_001556 [Penicillium canescens]|uniref:Uncharacterized protein n=1 Tax=Penicillium canescens TaxID=5083 RepID=A0AAD6II74_PENCN|nr:hypothetical protein N7444_006821 [Penicillium canescens]KAJ6051022.1 hypothetical protein N7460_001556 [Penicillium canescens]